MADLHPTKILTYTDDWKRVTRMLNKGKAPQKEYLEIFEVSRQALDHKIKKRFGVSWCKLTRLEQAEIAAYFLAKKHDVFLPSGPEDSKQCMAMIGQFVLGGILTDITTTYLSNPEKLKQLMGKEFYDGIYKYVTQAMTKGQTKFAEQGDPEIIISAQKRENERNAPDAD